MPLELGVWRIDGPLTRLSAGPLDLESRLEDILEREIAIAQADWMVIGRQVITPHGGRIDLLALNRDGNLVLVELKRDHMSRDIVTQILDYGSWAQSLRAEDIAPIFNDYRYASICRSWRSSQPVTVSSNMRRAETSIMGRAYITALIRGLRLPLARPRRGTVRD